MNLNGQPETEQSAAQDSSPSERQHVGKWVNCVRKARAKANEGPFKRIRSDIKFARSKQWQGQTDMDDPRYVANFTQRHLATRAAALYAKNPVAVATVRQRLYYAVWDGNQSSIMQAQQIMAEAPNVMAQATIDGADPLAMQRLQQQVMQAQELLADYAEGNRMRRYYQMVGKTLELVWAHQVGEQIPPFKSSMKALVLRALTTGVGYLKIGFHRLREFPPEHLQRVNDVSEQLARLQARMEQAQSDEWEEDSVEAAELEQLLAKLESDEYITVREGLTFDFPKSTSLIVDPAVTDLRNFVGAGWVAEEFNLTTDEIHATYGVSVQEIKEGQDSSYGDNDRDEVIADGDDPVPSEGRQKHTVWEVWDKANGVTFTIMEGYSGYLKAPASPPILLERFWPYFTLVFNPSEVELSCGENSDGAEKDAYPLSDVQLMRPMQTEHNLSRQRLREHRDAARPGYVTPAGRLETSDKNRLEARAAHDVIELNGLTEQDDVRRILQPIPTNNIDPNLYETGSMQSDMYQTIGTQEAVMGGLSGASATEASISESSRLTTIGSSVDELDDFLTEVATSASHILLTEMSEETVRAIVGPGAKWPTLSTNEIVGDIFLRIRAGSSGRPNKSAELQNFERMMPFLIQMPGLNPKVLAQELVTRLDDNIDVDALFVDGTPSVVAQNANAQPGTGDASNDPTAQGMEGRDKTAVEQGDSNLGPRPPAPSRVLDPNVRR